MAKSKKENKIIWVIINKKTLESEVHEVSFIDDDSYWDQIRFLVDVNTKKRNKIIIDFKPNNICTLTVWA